MNEYLDRVLQQIRCKKARPFIKRELQNHIEDQMQDNIQSGMDKEAALEEAIKDMGDPVETGISLDRIHRPQAAWGLLLLIGIISILGIVIQFLILSGNTELKVHTSSLYPAHILLGLAVMMILYFLDYTFIARFSKVIAGTMIALCFVTLLFGLAVNGKIAWLHLGRFSFSTEALMLMYAPVYGGVLYKYRNTGYSGVFKSILWMILPVFLLLRMPALVTSLTLFVSLMVLLTIAICKGWFRIPKKKTIITVWGVFAGLPVLSVLTLYFGNLMPAYQLARLKSIFTGSYDENSTAGILRSLFQNSKFSSSTESSALENLHGFNSEFVLAYLSAAYGLIIAALICCVLTVLLISIFSAVIKQKNQLGLLTGCGSAMIFLESFLVNILVNIGLLQVGNTFLPFFSAGGSFIIISYALLGVVLSIYRHKNIYPRHVNVSTIKIKSL